MTKILINAKVLQQMLADQPELEVELVKNAAAQVAETFKKRVDTHIMVNQMIANLEQQLHYRTYPLSKTINETIDRQVTEAAKKILIDQAGNLIKEAVRKAMDDHKIWIQNNLNGIIIDKVNAAMRAATEAAVKGALK